MGDMADYYRAPFGSSFEPSGSKTIECRYCHTAGFVWGRHENKWRLMKPNGTAHVCKAGTRYYGALARRQRRLVKSDKLITMGIRDGAISRSACDAAYERLFKTEERSVQPAHTSVIHDCCRSGRF